MEKDVFSNKFKKGDIAFFFFNGKWNVIEITNTYKTREVEFQMENLFGKLETKKRLHTELLTTQEFECEYQLYAEGIEKFKDLKKGKTNMTSEIKKSELVENLVKSILDCSEFNKLEVKAKYAIQNIKGMGEESEDFEMIEKNLMTFIDSLHNLNIYSEEFKYKK